MKIYGYESLEDDSSDFMEMSEVTISANAKDLREIALFINQMADKMESNPNSFEHAHLQDNWPNWNNNSPDIIIGASE